VANKARSRKEVFLSKRIAETRAVNKKKVAKEVKHDTS